MRDGKDGEIRYNCKHYEGDVLKEYNYARDVVSKLDNFQGMIYIRNDKDSFSDVADEIDNIYDGLAYIGYMYNMKTIYIMIRDQVKRIDIYSYDATP
uniref:Uncharacterized protein n=1 Tax=Pithovirus LCPAC406 TaxID=2506599 RepID=A0A481ZDC7_9VIRU|nr:MAG: hypothetical protein LCPAC406_01010 [Pithovirus LCPAC406]